MKTIHFNRETMEFGYLSNFYAAGFEIDGAWYTTSEHYYQSMKFAPVNQVAAEQVRLAETPTAAAKLGRRKGGPLRSDWEEAKDDVMRKAIFAKFTQNPSLKKKLRATKGNMLAEHTRNDKYWGDGGDGSGKNMLGKLLMELRSQFLSE